MYYLMREPCTDYDQQRKGLSMRQSANNAVRSFPMPIPERAAVLALAESLSIGLGFTYAILATAPAVGRVVKIGKSATTTHLTNRLAGYKNRLYGADLLLVGLCPSSLEEQRLLQRLRNFRKPAPIFCRDGSRSTETLKPECLATVMMHLNGGERPKFSS